VDSKTERTGKRFFTETNIEVPAVTTEQMREVDRIAMEETGPNLFQMMENAGRNLALLALENLGKNWQQAKIVVLAGSGGNGGGGICAARHLANRGANVTLCLAAPDGMGEVPAWQHRIYQSTSGKEVKPEELGSEPVDLILDALIGYSLQSAPRGVAAELIQWANGTNASIVSLDVPSGVDSTTGDTPGDFMRAHSTMTLALPKTGLFPEKTGDLILADIGIPEQTYHQLGLKYVLPFGNQFRIPLTLR
jgi:NAD(P)H-hydrate epimerase